MNVITIKEVAEILKLHPRTIAKLARDNQIPATRIGRVWRFDESAVMDWFNSQLARAKAGGLVESGDNGQRWNGTTRLSDLLSEDTVQFVGERRTKQEVLEALATLAMRTGRVASFKGLLTSLNEREQMCPTAFERGVAFPHPRRPLPEIERPVLAMLVSGPGVDFGAPDGAPTQVFVLVCSPDDRTHVKLLSQLARLFRSREAIPSLAKCQTPGRIVREIDRLEKQLTPNGN